MDNNVKHCCVKCDSTFSCRKYLRQHIRRVHIQGQQECTQCKKLFSSNDSLTRHVKLMHTQHEKLKCTQCSKEYQSPNGLRDHMLGHKGQLKKPCPVCNKKLYHNHLKRHLETHKDVKERKTVQCKECDSTFFEKDKLNRHMLTHKGDNRKQCPICLQKVIVLSVHLKTHTEQTLLYCQICSKAFKSKQGLHFHMQSHTQLGS